MDKKLEINFLNKVIKNPIMPASGTFNAGFEINSKFYPIQQLGAIVCKTITLEPRNGNKGTRIAKTDIGMLNAIGLENLGLENFLLLYKDFLAKMATETQIIINIAGKEINDYLSVIQKLNSESWIFAFELNVSCPNVQHGIEYMENETIFSNLITECKLLSKKPIIVKLSTEGIKISKLALLAEKAGADALTMLNTFKGLKINLNSRKPELGTTFGGYSGKAIKPIVLKNIFDVYKVVKIPIIGVGGIDCAEDVLEFMYAGATCVQVGTANFINPAVMKEIISQLPKLMQTYQINKLQDIIGIAHKTKKT